MRSDTAAVLKTNLRAAAERAARYFPIVSIFIRRAFRPPSPPPRTRSLFLSRSFSFYDRRGRESFRMYRDLSRMSSPLFAGSKAPF